MKQYTFFSKLGDEYNEVLFYILDNGQVYYDERGFKYKEAEPIAITTYNPMYKIPEEVLPQYVVQRYGSRFIIDYSRRFVEGIDEAGFVYSYGTRLYECNQLHKAIEKIKQHKWTRRATITIRKPQDIDLDDPPCLTMLDFKLRHEGLSLYAVFRSHDMENGYPLNWYALLMLLYHVATQLDVTPYRITTVSLSAHVYLWGRNLR